MTTSNLLGTARFLLMLVMHMSGGLEMCGTFALHGHAMFITNSILLSHGINIREMGYSDDENGDHPTVSVPPFGPNIARE